MNGFDKLLCIITGPERNGTTWLEYMICSAPGLFAGFETGLLLSDRFEECEPFNEWIYEGDLHWGVSNKKAFEDGLSYDERYQNLFKYKGSFDGEIQKLIRESPLIVDKTPAYFRKLDIVIKKVPSDIPIIITIKYLHDDYHSKCVKRDQPKTYVEETHKQLEILRYMKRQYHSNVHLFLYDDLVRCPNVHENMSTILSYKMKCSLDITKYFEKIPKGLESCFPYIGWSPTTIATDKYNICPLVDKNFVDEYNSLIDELKINIV